jgi:mRNA interferase HicA
MVPRGGKGEGGASQLSRVSHEPRRALRVAHICAMTAEMTGDEFERKIRRLGRRRSVPVSFDRGHGKGSHGRLYFGDRFTTLKDRRKEIGPGLLAAMLDQLGLTKTDLEA